MSKAAETDLKGSREKKDRKLIRSEDLFQECREVVIQHDEQYYRLMITKARKLILTK